MSKNIRSFFSPAASSAAASVSASLSAATAAEATTSSTSKRARTASTGSTATVGESDATALNKQSTPTRDTAPEASVGKGAFAAIQSAPAAATNGAAPTPNSDESLGIFSGLNEDWRQRLASELKKPYIRALDQFVQREYNNNVVYPPLPDIFAAMNHCHFDDVKVVIIGQDPYHGPGQAHGLCFSVKHGVLAPPSLKNVFKELKEDVGARVPSHGCLEQWSRQGVLLLNTTLSVRQGQPLSHAGKGWETFTDAVIRELGKREDGLVFLLWGKPAQQKCAMINQSQHKMITSSHPSPLGATKTNQPFIGSKCFSRCNQYLRELGKEPINWQIS